MKPALLFAGLFPLLVTAQELPPAQNSTASYGPEWNMGLGIGIDYGGFGVQLQCRPLQRLVIFLGGGYALAGFGYNAGLQGRILPNAKLCPFVSAMYGYNAVVVIKNAEQYNKFYYGPTFGLGMEIHGRNPDNFWRFGILIPLRPQEFQDDLDALRNNPAIQLKSEPPDLGISIAYHFGV